MKNEIIKEIAVNDKNELLLKLVSNGNSSYQYIYREATGVYWDENQKAFKSTPMNKWTISEWFLHIKNTLRSVLNVELTVDKRMDWKNIPNEEKQKIKIALQEDA